MIPGSKNLNTSLKSLEKEFIRSFKNCAFYSDLGLVYKFAKTRHINKRSNGQEYIIHPLRIIIRMHDEFHINSFTMLASMLLHDIIEDTKTTLNEIENLFGKRIAKYVDVLTSTKKSPDETPIEKIERKKAKYNYLLTQPKNIRLLKLFDVIDNISDYIQYNEVSVIKKKLPRWLYELRYFYLVLAKKTDNRIASIIDNYINYFIGKGFIINSDITKFKY